jgi:hypothetical protein
LDKSPKGPATFSDLTSLKEKMKQLPPQPEQPQTGAVQSEEVMRLPTEDRYQKRDRRRSTLHYKIWKKKWDDDISFERARKTRKWTPKQEMEAIQAAKPKWYKEYQEEIIAAARARKLIRYKLSNKSYRELYDALPESEKNAFDSWNRWGDSWMRRHGAGNVGKMNEGRAAQFMAVIGTRA